MPITSSAQLCEANKILKDGAYNRCQVTRDSTTGEFSNLTERGCEIFCENKCNALGFSASNYTTLGQFFRDKKLPYTIVYRGRCIGQREAAKSYYETWKGKTGRMVDQDSNSQYRGKESCSLVNGQYLVYYFHASTGCSPAPDYRQDKKMPEEAPAVS